MRILITGANGMLAHDVRRVAERAGHELVLVDLPELDITDARAVDALCAAERPAAVLNCAAWTNVDGAESAREQAHAVNATGAGNLARAAAALDIQLVHVSTDYVFSGIAPRTADDRPRPYLESDPTGPRSVYGETKLAGEQEVLAASKRHAVARSAWLFGTDGPNFVETMLRLADGGEAVRVVEDQIGCPTWTGHLAPALLGLLAHEVSGLVHLAGAGHVSWHGFAREIFRQAEIEREVRAITTAEMPRPAPRPAWSALESERTDLFAPLPPWQDGLAGHLAARAGIIRA